MAITIGVLTTYPPTQCGLATFSFALVDELARAGAAVGVVRVVDEMQPDLPRVVHQWQLSDPTGAVGATAALDRFDVVVVQHEYGIFGGPDGVDVLDVMENLSAPVVSVLHTVLTSPTPHQHAVLAAVVQASDAVVTMTETARQRLVAGWDVDPASVTVIAHGAEDNRGAPFGPTLNTRPVVLTWGLLGQGKGIEWALAAMAELTDLVPSPLYQVVGQTHPRVLEREGEAYRQGLHAAVSALDIDSMVEFDGRYLDGPTLRGIVRAADIVLLPYDSREQVTSGVLTEAVVAGKPVVSTSFPHAVELLSGGAGLLVPQRDPAAIAEALRRLLTDPHLSARTAACSRALAPGLLWPAVAQQYVTLCRSLRAARKQSVA